MNDLNKNIENMIYIIPSNFLFSSSGSNKIRKDFLPLYNITEAVIFEKQIFDFTGTNVAILFFKRKPESNSPVSFKGLKIMDNSQIIRDYLLTPKNKYRAGSEFQDFIKNNNNNNNIKVNYYLMQKDVDSNSGNNQIEVIDSNEYINNNYIKKIIQVNDSLSKKITNNILFIRTVDSGSSQRAGLYTIKESFSADGILVSKNPYRTNPIQIFFSPELTKEQQIKLKDYFNKTLEELRKLTDSEFMTTYKYSKAKYTRKYLGLSQVKKLIQTFPLH